MLGLGTVLGYRIHARDGRGDQVADVLFDDRTWTVRYIVAETGGWLHHRRTLISPLTVTSVVQRDHQLSVDLTREQVANAPSVDTDLPISRQMELRYRDSFAWPFYWIAGCAEPFDFASYARSYAAAELVRAAGARRKAGLVPGHPESDPHLRSADAIVGYHVVTREGDVGRVTDFMLEVSESGWRVRDLVFEAGHWPHHAKASIAPCWIEGISWGRRSVMLSVPREMVEAALAEPGETS